MMGLVIEDGDSRALAFEALPDGGPHVLQNGVVVLHADRTVHDAFGRVDNPRCSNSGVWWQRIPQIALAGKLLELLQEPILNGIGLTQNEHTIYSAFGQQYCCNSIKHVALAAPRGLIQRAAEL